MDSPTRLIFQLNDELIQLDNPEPGTTLLSFIRGRGLTGTKLGCGEGGCGACTVLLSYSDAARGGAMVHKSATSCLMPLTAVDGMRITTIEGMKVMDPTVNPSGRGEMHPIQQFIAKLHGTQCGFCSPGFVMSMFATHLCKGEGCTPRDIEDGFDGNLCRCTGYRPILEASREYLTHSDGKVEPPTTHPALAARAGLSLRFVGNQSTWYRPTTLRELLRLRAANPDAVIVAGATDVGLRFKDCSPPQAMIAISHVPELAELAIDREADCLRIGASVTLSELRAFLAHHKSNQPAPLQRMFEALEAQFERFGSTNVRNVATLGGSLANCSPVSDAAPIIMAMNASLHARSADSERIIPIKEWIQGYRQTALAPSEVLTTITLPLFGEHEYCCGYKQTRRREDDICMVNGTFRVRLEPGTNEISPMTVADCTLAYGGMSWRTVFATRAMAYLIGKPWTRETCEGAMAHIMADLPLAPNAPGAAVHYRKAMSLSLWYKFFISVLGDACPRNPEVDVRERLSMQMVPPPLPASTAHHDYEKRTDTKVVGRPEPHLSAKLHATGQAKYTVDITVPHMAHGVLLTSTHAHARVLSIDTHEALAMPGVIRFVGAQDVRGSNAIGPIVRDELCFIPPGEGVATSLGSVLGVLVAETEAQARQAIRKIQVEYEPLPVINTIHDAIGAQSFFGIEPKRMSRGDLEEGLSRAEHIVDGKITAAGQVHVALEVNNSLVVPGEDDELLVYACTQNPSLTQRLVSSVAGVREANVAVRVRRLGGAFGGKESRSCFVTCAAAVAAQATQRPVKIVLSRDEESSYAGQRHPFYVEYRIGVTRAGKLTAMDMKFYVNAGDSHDLSLAVVHRMITHVDGSYLFPAVRVEARACKTNRPSNTALRGFGAPQAAFIIEAIMTHVADQCGFDQADFRQGNFYKVGDHTPFNQVIEDTPLDAIWPQLLASSEYRQRQASMRAFNEANRWVKRGLSIIPLKFGLSFESKFMNQAGALVHIQQDGTVRVVHGGIEMGQGVHTKIAQVAAEALGVPLEKVVVATTSTETVPNTSPTAASTGSDLNGMAVLDACNKLLAQLAPLRDEMPDASLSALAKTAHFQRIQLSATGFYATPGLDTETKPFHYFTWGAAVAETEIDCLTGDMLLRRADVLYDVGASLNTALDIGQIEGAFVQGVGWLTCEEPLWSSDAKLLNTNVGYYKIPATSNMPRDFRVSLLKERPNPAPTIYSSKGIGEPPFCLSAVVLLSAMDAVGAGRRELGQAGPQYPEHLFVPMGCDRVRMSCPDPIVSQTTDQTGEVPVLVPPS
eukprot:gnl/Trimastix_PCT/1688.p1 GENE.gnl/Trimastix_PCT/1688~~gnl/Trimastix_PCT/1688.p1  ORF type:complete len:1314 (+),score=274.45 gnl/Trimastix_PCT/1688:41-3943(+)